MAKVSKRSRKSPRSIIIISIILFISIALNIFIYLKTTSYKNNYDNINNNLTNITSSLEEKESEYKKMSDRLELVNTIDDKTNEVKKDFFTKAKQLEDKIIAGESNEKIAYLTFDDGPYYSSYQFLEILDEYDVFATFFTIGDGKDICYDNRSQDCSGLYALEASKGHTMANHTYTHGIWSGLYDSPESFMYQVKLQENLILERTGIKTNIVRFPGGANTAGRYKNRIIELLRENGYGWVNWTASIGDGGNLRDYDLGWKNFTNNISADIEVLLQHDYNKTTLQLLPNEIKYLKEHGYHIFPLFYESNMINK